MTTQDPNQTEAEAQEQRRRDAQDKLDAERAEREARAARGENTGDGPSSHETSGEDPAAEVAATFEDQPAEPQTQPAPDPNDPGPVPDQ